MTRTLVAYVCTACGHTAPKWLGRCPGCGEWNTLEEEAARPKARNGRSRPAAVARLADVDTAEGRRMATGIDELDRVLGGGLVPGSLVLIGGEPGVGKSSLLLQALASCSARGLSTLLVSGEESPAQVRMRAERIAAAEGVGILAETDLEVVVETIAAELPDVCVIDSVQTLHAADVGSGAGSVAQVREAADRLLRLAKSRGVAIVLVGHVTKDGTVAGPRVLEHLVDAVLQFEGDRYRHLRVLRAVKNRFGSTDEIGIFEMTGAGLTPVVDPSSALAEDGAAGPGSVLLPAIEGSRPILLEVQALVAPSDLAMPRRQATGFDRNRLSMLAAVLGRHAGISARLVGRVRERRGRRARRRAGGRPGRGSRDRVVAPRPAAGRAARMLRRDRPDGPPAARRPHGAAARRGRKAGRHRGRRARRHVGARLSHDPLR